MKLEQLRVPLIPRSSIDCFDLGIMFFGRHFMSLVRMWCWVAIPSMVLVYLGVWYQQLHLGYVLPALFLLTGVWSTVLVARTSRAVFGEPFDWSPSTTMERTQLAGLMFKALGARLLILLGLGLFLLPGWWSGERVMTVLGLLLFAIFGWWIGVRTSFFPEKAYLASMEGRSRDRRTSELIKQELGQLMQRSFAISFMVLFVVISLFSTVDFFSNLLFQKPIIWGQILEDQLANYSFNNSPFEHFRDLLVYDPLALSVLTGVILFVYPMVRFAWFFCYIDLRVRGDFWDLELRFQKETERLQESRA